MVKISIAALLCVSCILAASPVTAQDKVGIEACDDFIAKYEACVTTKLPAAAQPPAKDVIGQMRTLWKGMAANPGTKDRIPGLCQQTAEAIKQQTAVLGCQW
jgi:hypothetical protein